MRTDANQPAAYLRRLGERGEERFDIAEAAVMLAALDHPTRPLERYLEHLREVAAAARDELHLLYRAEEAGRALANLMHARFGYDGDRLAYDAIDNADMMAVIDRRRGLPVSLGILYLHAARAGGLVAAGLNTPGHFLMRIEAKGRAVILDPFNGGALVERERLGGPPGMASAAPGEMEPGEPVGDTEVLLRLENNIRLRALKAGDRSRALAIAERMVLIAPSQPQLWIDLAHLHEAGGSLGAAMQAYENCLNHAKPGAALHNEAALALAGLKRRLN